MNAEAAFPVLLHMLQEMLPPHPFSPTGEYTWYDVWHNTVADVLGRWGKPEAIPALRATLQRLRTIEQEQGITGLDFWRYQESIAYALGQLGALDALSDFELPIDRKRLWTTTLAMGYLNAEKVCKSWLIRMFQDMLLLDERPEIFALLAHVLQHNMGLSAQEAETYILSYDGDYYDRHPSFASPRTKCGGGNSNE
jgi:hypothetical protein